MDEAASLAYVEELSEQLKNSLDHVSEADFPAFFEEMTKKLNKMYVETKKQYDEWQAVAAVDEKCLKKQKKIREELKQLNEAKVAKKVAKERKLKLLKEAKDKWEAEKAAKSSKDDRYSSPY